MKVQRKPLSPLKKLFFAEELVFLALLIGSASTVERSSDVALPTLLIFCNLIILPKHTPAAFRNRWVYVLAILGFVAMASLLVANRSKTRPPLETILDSIEVGMVLIILFTAVKAAKADGLM